MNNTKKLELQEKEIRAWAKITTEAQLWRRLANLWAAAEKNSDDDYVVVIAGYEKKGICDCLCFLDGTVPSIVFAAASSRLAAALEKMGADPLHYAWSTRSWQGRAARADFCRHLARRAARSCRKKVKRA